MSKTTHRLFALLCAAVALTGLLCVSVFAAGGTELGSKADPKLLTCVEIPMYIDNEYIGSGYVADSVPYVPLLAFTECMLMDQCDVVWEQDTDSATISSEVLTLSVTIGDGYMVANDRYFYLGDGVYNINGTIIVPLTVMAKIFSVDLAVDRELWSIRIDTGNIQIPDPASEVYAERDLYWLSRVITAEARTQPLDGMVGVGAVVMNRVKDHSGLFEDDVFDVIFQTGQFDVVRLRTIYCEPSEEAVIAAKLCLEGFTTVEDSLWFVNPQIGDARWFNMHKTYVTTIADHVFYV